MSSPSWSGRRRRLRGALAALVGTSGLAITTAHAQRLPANSAPAPSQVIPRDLTPAVPPHPGPVFGAPAAPPPLPAQPALAVDTGAASIDGGFADMAPASAAFVASIAHQHVTLAQLYGARRALEQAYARRGYVLARVVVPPQRLEPGAPVRVVVVDGFIERLDLSHLAAPLRRPVAARLAPLVGRRHITLAMIERALLLAGDLAGASLRSAIAPGSQDGGVLLTVEGGFTRIAGQIGADNSLPDSLSRWQMNAGLTLNGPLGLGDQLYATVGSQVDVARYGFPHAPLGYLVAGAIVPLGSDSAALTGEFLTSRSQPNPATGVPQSVSYYTRGRLALKIAAIRTRRQTLNLTGAYELVTQSVTLPQFGTQLSRDHYLAMRLAADWQGNAGPLPASLGLVVSQGVAGRDAGGALPTSRTGAVARFTNLEATAQAMAPGPDGFSLALVARGKTGFGKPQFVSEQFSLDAANGVSSFPSGTFTVDSGVTLRGELQAPALPSGRSLGIAPYVFGAGALGWIARPTAVEQARIRAASAGAGARISLGAIPLLAFTGASLALEYGHQFSNVAGHTSGQRFSLVVGMKF